MANRDDARYELNGFMIPARDAAAYGGNKSFSADMRRFTDT